MDGKYESVRVHHLSNDEALELFHNEFGHSARQFVLNASRRIAEGTLQMKTVKWTSIGLGKAEVS